MMKKTLVAALLASTLMMTAGCGTARRAAKDVLITLGSPGIILYGAGTDGAIDAKNIQKGFEGSDAVSVVAFPFTFLYRAVDHGLSCFVHAVDLLATPVYGLAELGGHPDTKIRPLQIYKDPWFLRDDDDATEDAETGESGK